MGQNLIFTGEINPVTGRMEYKQDSFTTGNATVTYDVSFAANPLQGTAMFTPFPSHTTELASSIYSPCSIVGCPEHANPLNAVESTLDVFGNPQVRVHLCDDHFRLFGSVTEEHKAVTENEEQA